MQAKLSCNFPAIGSFFGDISPQLGALKAAVFMHSSLLHGVLRTPLLFFDTTPTGRILSRFSKDVEVLDNKLPMELNDLIYCLFEVNA
jgi:ATP-binding cassette subfamily C (CFTR/MRP) protein 1